MLNIPYPSVNVRKHLLLGHAALDAEHAVGEVEKQGQLRAGTSGCVGDDGRVYGECHRIAHLRHTQIDKPHELPRKLMFQAGEANEDLWNNVLVRGWGKTERHADVQKQGSFGVIGGHPDIILLNPDDTRNTVLELKLVSASNSALYKQVEGTPDAKNLVQTATYMWMTGLPGVLCYTSRTDFSIEFKRKQFGIAKVEPFYRLFYLSFRDDRLYYRDEYKSDEVETNCTGTGIIEYYQRVADMAYNKELGDRPTGDHINGTPAAWSKCDPRYCAFAPACDNYERDYATWRDAASQIAKGAA